MAEESVLDTSIPPNEADNSDTLTEKLSELDCESMIQALAFYNKILENTDAKDIKKKKRVQAMEQYFAEINNKQQDLIKNAVAEELDRQFPAPKDISMIPPKAYPPSTTSYADSLKKPVTTERNKEITKNKSIKKHVTTVKPKAENGSSSDTRKTEFKLQDDLAKNFDILKPELKKPQIICFDVSKDTSGEKLLEDLHFQFSDAGHGKEDFHIKHHFNSKRGVNWILILIPASSKNNPCVGRSAAVSRAARVHGARAWGCGRFGLGLLCSTTHQLTDGFGLGVPMSLNPRLPEENAL
ncbi:hypothetical protein CEXT_21831 [Caerostris extrusa]|uniref:Uncharacterized protein n=1 Tax=Caerostris extrusa TaxID=172846 RepID=A0AAV4TP00_CAEEX|nr:hypothetical protein CEXT_21831 [Caerostris extrusa]